MIWSPAAVWDLKKYAETGLTSGEIARKLECSSGAVIGKCSRLGIKLKGRSGDRARHISLAGHGT
jgi:hypothetical protein